MFCFWVPLLTLASPTLLGAVAPPRKTWQATPAGPGISSGDASSRPRGNSSALSALQFHLRQWHEANLVPVPSSLRRGKGRLALPATAFFVGYKGDTGVAHFFGSVAEAPMVEAGPETETEEKELSIASPMQICVVYACLFGPLLVAGLALHAFGQLDKYWVVLLPVLLVTVVVGFDLANQSLSALMHAPNAISAFHAATMTLVLGAWCMSCEGRQRSSVDLRNLRFWTLVMTAFTIYQMLNHSVSYFCSLSERIVFQNLAPVVSMLLELMIFPVDKQPHATVSTRTALALMAGGAVLFSTQKKDFTATGFTVAGGLVLVLVPYRIVQRWAVTTKCRLFPVGLLGSLDGLLFFTPSAIVSAFDGVTLGDFVGWLQDPSVRLLLLATAATFIGMHVCGILLLRIGSATSYLVLHSMANIVVLTLGWLLFQDDIFSSGLMFSGLLITMCAGVWYSVEAHRLELLKNGQPKEAETLPQGAASLLGTARPG